MTGYYVMWYRDTSVGCSHLNNKTLRVDEETIVKRVTNLEEGNRYTIAVKSFNLAGVSRGSSNNITIMTQESAPSGPPTSVRNGTITPTSITVKWDEVPCLHRNGRITGYMVHVESIGQNDKMFNVGDIRETAILELMPSTEYTVQVAAVNIIGRGPFSNGRVYLTNDGLTISISYTSTTSLGIVWSLEEGATPANSTIFYSKTDTDCFNASSTITTSDTAYNLTGLEEHIRYFITVNAMLPDGGTRVDSISAFTMSAGLCIVLYHFSLFISTYNAAPSAPPTSVEVSVVNSTAITVQWGSVDCRHRNGEIIGYRVRYGEVGGGEGDRTAVQMVSGDSTGGSTTISGLTKETVYTVQVAAET
ncbi:Receptor-type tyrosine-protein phosphatase delta, partial [Geodia barretti]